MGLGITRASVISAVADKTGDDSVDAVVKIRRLINEKGPDFVNMGDWPFLRDDINFDLDTSNYKYSGSDVLPAAFKKVLGCYLLDGNQDRYYPFEVGIKRSYQWENPDDTNQDVPTEFCITRPESGYYEIQFNRLPDEAYVFYADIALQWTDLTGDADETIITKEYFTAFAHFISMGRAEQQGDLELIQTLMIQWSNPRNPRAGILERALRSLTGPMQRKQVTPLLEKRIRRDYAVVPRNDTMFPRSN